MHRLFTHILLTLAAVLLIPQALDCCAHAHTVLESLATGDATAAAKAAPAHSGHHDGHTPAPPDTATAQDGLDKSQVVTVVSPAGSGPALQSPSDGAGTILAFGAGVATITVRLIASSSAIPTGWTDGPGTPPPR
jgi:hypothetical protein